MNNELVKLLGAYILAEKNHRKNADLLRECLYDWSDDPVLFALIELQIKNEEAAAKAIKDMIFNVTKQKA